MEKLSEQFENLLTDLIRSEGYLIINKSLIKKIGLFPAILLSNYFEKHKYFKEHSPKNEGWFFMTHKKIMEELGIKAYTITQAKKKLIKLGLIEIERRGIPSKEWITINFMNFYELMLDKNYKTLVPPKTSVLQHTKTKELQHPKTAGLYNTTYYNNKTNTNNKTKIKRRRRLNYIVPPSDEGETVSNSKNEMYLPIAKKLANLITSKKRVKINGHKLNGWANSIRLMVTADGIKPTRITDALDWYTEHSEDDYVPVIESGSSLREKFIKLENAIERDKNPKTKFKTKSGYKKGKLKYKKAEKL